MNSFAISERRNALHAGISSSLIAVRSMARALPLLIAARPKTPLRVLCIVAFDTLHMLRKARPLPMHKVRALAALLDFGACANAAFDDKEYCENECRRTWQLLDGAGIGLSVSEYLRKLNDLESGRPLPGGDNWQFRKAVSYREAVVRLSLGMAAATAMGDLRLDEAVRATYRDADINLLFRIAMQCQIVDDVLDYSKDVRSGLPSFLTTSQSLSRAFELTRLAALGYADDRDLPPSGDLFPLRSALFLVSAGARLAIAFGRWRRRTIQDRSGGSRCRSAIRRISPMDLGGQPRKNCEHHSPRGALAQCQPIVHRGKQVSVRPTGTKDELNGVLAAWRGRSQPLHLR